MNGEYGARYIQQLAFRIHNFYERSKTTQIHSP